VNLCTCTHFVALHTRNGQSCTQCYCAGPVSIPAEYFARATSPHPADCIACGNGTGTHKG
jgi:hypothetical protein